MLAGVGDTSSGSAGGSGCRRGGSLGLDGIALTEGGSEIKRGSCEEFGIGVGEYRADYLVDVVDDVDGKGRFSVVLRYESSKFDECKVQG